MPRTPKKVAAPQNATPPALFEAGAEPELVDVPPYRALTISGAGAPASPAFAAAIGALYRVAYTLKFARKKQGAPTFKVGVLVGEWRAAGLPSGRAPPPDSWRWRLQLAVPPDVTATEVRGARGASTVALARIPARRCVRMMHVGPYSSEPKTLRRMRAFAAERATSCAPWHLEAYCSDPGRTPAARLRTSLLIAAD